MTPFERLGSSRPSGGAPLGEAGGVGHGERGNDPARLTLLASAIAGRTVEVASLRPGEAPWTDGRTVFVDAEMVSGRQVAAVAVQASLLGAGSLEAAPVSALSRRSALVRRYLAIEGHRALAAEERLLPSSVAGLIDRSVASRTTSSQQSLAIAASRETVDEPPDVFGTIRARAINAVDDRRAGPSAGVESPSSGETGTDASRLADFGAQLEDEGEVDDPFSSPIGGGGAIGRLLQRLFSERRSKWGGPPGADSPTHRSPAGRRAGRTLTLSTDPVPVSDVSDGSGDRGSTYPEWDHRAGRYRARWCTVHELDPPTSELVPFAPPATSRALRAPLAHLGLDLERHRRQLQGDDVDVDAAVEAQIELRAGSVPHEAVYIDTLRTRRDLAVLILLDISGSAGERSATGEAVHLHQRRAASALATALYELGDRVAVYGFRSRGRRSVHMVRVKGFDDALDELVMLRIGGLRPAAYTRLGAAVRHGTTILEREAGTARRLVVVLSDGFAYDHGYEPAYGEADTRRALSETRRRGIGALCLTIGATTGAEALRRVFGVAAYAAIPGPEALPGVAGPLFHAALRSAELQRRVFQRRGRTKDLLATEEKRA